MECSTDRCEKSAAVKGLCRSCYSNEYQKAKRRAAKPAELTCEFCGKAYTPLRYYADSGRNRFCSRGCKQTARNRSPEKLEDTRRRYYVRRYGITLEEADELRLAGCAICGRTEAPGRWDNSNLHIDHDHVTGKIRGVLCNACNLGVGYFQDDPELLRRAIAYLS